jgi:predicted Holliday junction resolvase-like endonuclease
MKHNVRSAVCSINLILFVVVCSGKSKIYLREKMLFYRVIRSSHVQYEIISVTFKSILLAKLAELVTSHK